MNYLPQNPKTPKPQNPVDLTRFKYKLIIAVEKNMANQPHFFSEQEGTAYDYMFKLVLIGDSQVGKS